MNDRLFGRWMVAGSQGLVFLDEWIGDWFSKLPWAPGSIKISENDGAVKSLTSKDGSLSDLLVEHLKSVLPESVSREEHTKFSAQIFEAPDYKGTSKAFTIRLVCTPSPEIIRQLAISQAGAPQTLPEVAGFGSGMPTISSGVTVSLNVNELITMMNAPFVRMGDIMNAAWEADMRRAEDLKKLVVEIATGIPQAQIKAMELQAAMAERALDREHEERRSARQDAYGALIQGMNAVGGIAQKAIEVRPDVADKVAKGIEGIGTMASKMAGIDESSRTE